MTKSFHPYFTISGQFDPDDITFQLGIEPSWVQKIGDAGPPDALDPRLGAVWSWQPQDDGSNDVGDQLAFMAGALSEQREKVASLSREFYGTFHVYHRQDAGRGDWFLSSKTLRLITALQVNIKCEQV